MIGQKQKARMEQREWAFLELLRLAGPAGRELSVRQLARDLGCSVRTVQHLLRRLEARGVLVATARVGEFGEQLASVYRLAEPDFPSPGGPDRVN